MTDSLKSFGFDLGKLWGQLYDIYGAGNMAGTIGGIAALISGSLSPLCISYPHYNLAVVKSLEVTSVYNMQQALESAIAENKPESMVSKLKDLCHTW